MIKVGIVGGTGYTGIELLRLLVRHPGVSLQSVTSRGEAGKRVDALFPSLRGACDLIFNTPDNANLEACDVVFFATPNGIAMQQAKALLDSGVKLVDLSADFRIKDVSIWEQWYGMTHACPELVEQAVYGLPEVNREAIKNASLVANPGCYPTAVQLGFLPLIKRGLVDTNDLVADAKSGVSGAGRTADIGIAYAEVNESFKAYKASGHRHLPEIEQGLTLAANQSVNLTFVPHLTPMIRGIHATLYANLQVAEDLQACYEAFYQDEPFVDVLTDGQHPETRSVKGANHCRISVFQPQGRNKVVVLSVIDNLVKGAAGQAIQNMNLMFGLDERLGLQGAPLCP